MRDLQWTWLPDDRLRTIGPKMPMFGVGSAGAQGVVGREDGVSEGVGEMRKPCSPLPLSPPPKNARTMSHVNACAVAEEKFYLQVNSNHVQQCIGSR